MIYPAFTQQKECGPYTITVSMNLDTWELFNLACERLKFEGDRLYKNQEEVKKYWNLEEKWSKFASRLWHELRLETPF